MWELKDVVIESEEDSLLGLPREDWRIFGAACDESERCLLACKACSLLHR